MSDQAEELLFDSKIEKNDTKLEERSKAETGR